MSELIVLLNEEGQPIGSADKSAIHGPDTPLHLAFSCYVFNEQGKFLMTMRGNSKKVWPGVWTNSVCGHPAPHEKMEEAIKRRLQFELGMTATDFRVVLPDYRYKTPPFNGIIENEICPVYVARASSDPRINKDEVEQYEWVDWQKFCSDALNDENDIYSWWSKDQLKQLKNNQDLLKYTMPA